MASMCRCWKGVYEILHMLYRLNSLIFGLIWCMKRSQLKFFAWEIKELRNKRIFLVKLLGRNHVIKGAKWEIERWWDNNIYYYPRQVNSKDKIFYKRKRVVTSQIFMSRIVLTNTCQYLSYLWLVFLRDVKI